MFKIKVEPGIIGNRYKIIDNERELHCYIAGVGDLCWEILGAEDNTFVISKKEDKVIYDLIDEVYQAILRADNKKFNKQKRRTATKGRVYTDIIFGNYHDYDDINFVDLENNRIRYITDDFNARSMNELLIEKRNGYYRLEIVQEIKSPWSKAIRMRSDGSRYGYFFIPFMWAYREMEGIALEYGNEKEKVLKKKI